MSFSVFACHCNHFSTISASATLRNREVAATSRALHEFRFVVGLASADGPLLCNRLVPIRRPTTPRGQVWLLRGLPSLSLGKSSAKRAYCKAPCDYHWPVGLLGNRPESRSVEFRVSGAARRGSARPGPAPATARSSRPWVWKVVIETALLAQRRQWGQWGPAAALAAAALS